MNGLFRIVIVIAVALGLAVCAMDTGGRPYRTLHDSIWQIKPGMTRAEVQKLVGNPIMVFNFPRMQQESWLYD